MRVPAQSIHSLLPAGSSPRPVLLGIARGIRLHLDLRTNARLWSGLYELELNRHFRRLARPGHRCFDVGGHVGYHALLLAKLTRAEVVSFEPYRDNVHALRANVALNPALMPYVTAEHASVADRSRSRPGTEGQRYVTLDEFAATTFVPDLVKIDVDGFEDVVLEGAREILRDSRPHVIVETHSEALEHRCARILASHGYRALVVDQRRVLREHRPLPHNRWLVAEGRPRSVGRRDGAVHASTA